MADSQKAPLRFWSFFFSLQGRVSRGPFLVFALITHLGLLAARQIIGIVAARQFGGDLSSPSFELTGLCQTAIGLVDLVVLWPNFALLFKRFHDAGLSGLWSLPYFWPVIQGIFSTVMFTLAVQRGDLAAAEQLTPDYVKWSIIGVTWGLIAIGALLPARKAANRFGSRPGYSDDRAQDVF